MPPRTDGSNWHDSHQSPAARKIAMQEAQEVECPHCGAPTVFFVDHTEGTRQKLIEDCQVCCRAILFCVELIDGQTLIHTESTE
jgi:hypothetical protein